jgi:GNAT superfamily N-acetyltransferase
VCATSRITIRQIEAADLEQLIGLCAEHAAFERAKYERNGKIEKLRVAFDRTHPMLCGWIAECGGGFVGYATATIDFSTWNAEAFMHLDCLYVRDAHRGHGIGRRLMQAALEEARRRGIREMQWQTPDWNTDADRFYIRLGAAARRKLRYSLLVGRDGCGLGPE